MVYNQRKGKKMDNKLTKDIILKADDCKIESVDVPEWGGTLYLRVMKGTERDAFEAETYKDGKTDLKNFRSKLLVKTICDEKGSRIFSDDDAVLLGEKSAAVLDKLFDRVMTLNRFKKEDVDALVKN